MENTGFWAVIPAYVRHDKDISASEKLLYAEISAMLENYGKCYATNAFFAKMFNVTSTSVSRWISKLEEVGYIKRTIVYKEGTKEVESRFLELSTPINKNVYPPINTNVKDNYIYNNIYKDISTSIYNTNNNISTSIHNNKTITSFNKDLFDYWIEKSKESEALVKHKQLNKTIEKAIDIAIKQIGKDLDLFKQLIDRFIIIYEYQKNTDYKMKKRSMNEFFGQKAYQKPNLICYEFTDEGSKWRDYTERVGNAPRNIQQAMQQMEERRLSAREIKLKEKGLL